MMDGRRWQSPAAAAAAVEAAEEDAGGGVGGPSRRPPRRGMNRASPYGLGPRRWLPKPPVSSRIFPGVSRDHAAADNNQVDQCEPMDVTTHEARRVAHESKSKEPNTDATTNVAPALVNKVNLLPEGNHIHRNDGSVFNEIEKIIKQKIFSRDETEYLIEIMRSRTPDLCDEYQSAPKYFAKDSESTPFSNKLVTPTIPDVQNWGIDVFTPPIVHDVGSSPIELARAYMEAQTSATVHESQRRKFRALSHGVEIDNSASKLIPKVAVDTPVRWPGSVVRDHTNYLTPQRNKGRTLPPTSSRSPYSGSVFRRSVKRSGNLDTYSNSSGRPQLSTPFSVGSKAIEDKMTATGGVLGAQPSTSSEGAYADAVGMNTPFFPRDGTAATKNLAFSLERPHGKGTIESGSTIGRIPVADNISKRAAASVHPKSSQTAQKILQHLERTIPSPTAKPLELRQAAKRTTPVFIGSQYKVPDSVTSNGPKQSNINERGSTYQGISDAKKVQEPPSSSNHEESAPKIQSHVANPEVAEMTSSQHTSKPNLATAPAAMVFDKSSTSNGFMFSFPVTKTSVSLPEPPPTPTFFSPPKRSLPADINDIPKFTFGSSSSADNLVFSVDPASGSVGADEMDPTFKLGSDKKRELSFDVAGKDAVCF